MLDNDSQAELKRTKAKEFETDLKRVKEQRRLLRQEIRVTKATLVVRDYVRAAIEIEAVNLSNFQIHECEFHCLLGNSDHSKVWAQGRFRGEIQGGCAPGETFTIKLVVLDDQKWRNVPDNESTLLSVMPIAIYGIGEQPLYDAGDLASNMAHSKIFLNMDPTKKTGNQWTIMGTAIFVARYSIAP